MQRPGSWKEPFSLEDMVAADEAGTKQLFAADRKGVDSGTWYRQGATDVRG